MTGARVAPGGRGDVGLFAWVVSRVAGRATGTEPPKLFLTLGRHRKLFRAWLRFAGRDLDDPSWEALREHLDEREAIELCMLVGHYEMLATTIATLRIEPDIAFRG